MDYHVIGPAISAGVPLLVLASSYGSLNTRIKQLERQVEHAVTREEFRALETRINELVTEFRGLRSDLLMVLRERNER